jgi:hypothetical protein
MCSGPQPSALHAGMYSTLGSALTSRLRLGVAPCQQRLSRKIALPADPDLGWS